MIPESELIINSDGTIFHLHIAPHELADTVILVGDPGRVERVASHFQSVEFRRENREFCTITGVCNGRRVSVVSTGIGCDNIDIVLNELDALANVDFVRREANAVRRSLTIVRLGTSGAVQQDIRIGDLVMSAWCVGIDGLLNFYDGVVDISDTELEAAFVEQMGWGSRLARPYFVQNDPGLVELFSDIAIRGMTASAPGFYAPQGRVLRLGLWQEDYLHKIETFTARGMRITNFEMEGSAIAGLSRLMGHKSLTVCAIIAQRVAGSSNADYGTIIDNLIIKSLEKLTK